MRSDHVQVLGWWEFTLRLGDSSYKTKITMWPETHFTVPYNRIRCAIDPTYDEGDGGDHPPE